MTENVEKQDKVILGVLALDKKIKAKPMQRLIEQLNRRHVQVKKFGDRCIFEEDIRTWITCPHLLCFHSNGFPIHRAIRYIELRKPKSINDVIIQSDILLSRNKVYEKLREIGVPCPDYLVVERDEGMIVDDVEFVEEQDFIKINGVVMHKPFVEKPLNADDHNINIYYHSSQGGGCRKLFRKKDNKSSEFCPEENSVRKDSSYLYEKFMETKEMKDVKVYMVGDISAINYREDDQFYVYAEQRKAPSVDGIVERQENGLEKREVAVLTQQEINYSKKIMIGFKQMICGFDFLRVKSDGDLGFTSIVNDVNGFSNVKNEPQFYENAAAILAHKLHQEQANK